MPGLFLMACIKFLLTVLSFASLAANACPPGKVQGDAGRILHGKSPTPSMLEAEAFALCSSMAIPEHHACIYAVITRATKW
jgi:hypothetical protein